MVGTPTEIEEPVEYSCMVCDRTDRHDHQFVEVATAMHWVRQERIRVLRELAVELGTPGLTDRADALEVIDKELDR